jgi:hypothetical protein
MKLVNFDRSYTHLSPNHAGLVEFFQNNIMPLSLAVKLCPRL